MSRGTARIALIAAGLGLTFAPGAAAEIHWPGFGGGPGHSGAQNLAVGQMPMQGAYHVDVPGPVRTSVVTTGGSINQQVLAYGTVRENEFGGFEPRLFLRNLVKGDLIGGEEGIDFGATAQDAFGNPSPNGYGQVGSVTPVDSSGATQGQLFALFNDDDLEAQEPMSPSGTAPSGNDIGIAQIDPSSSTKPVVTSVAVGPPPFGRDGLRPQVTDGFTVNASPVLSPPGTDGSRSLLFVAQGLTGVTRLFKLTIDDAGSTSARIDAAGVQFVDVPGANPYASPTIAYIHDPSYGGTLPHVLVAGIGPAPALRAFRLASLAAGPQSAPAEGIAQTPVVAADPSGLLPGQRGASVSRSPAVFVAVDDGTGTAVHRFEQVEPSYAFTDTGEGPAHLSGTPGPALAVSQPYDAQTKRLGRGRVAVTTGANLYLLDSETLDVAAAMRDGDEVALSAGSTGFSRTAPLISGDHVYAIRDDGGQVVLRVSDGEPVCAAADSAGCEHLEFQPFEDALNGAIGLGQPALSNGFVQFASDAGVFVYRNSLKLRIVKPADGGLVSRTVPLQASVGAGRDVASVAFTLDGAPLAGATEPDAGGTFAAEFNSTDVPDGIHTLQADALDKDGNVVDSDQRTIRVDNIPDPVAIFTVAPSPALTGETVRFDAVDSHTNPPGGGLTYRWDLDGNGTYETDGGYKPRTTKVYEAAGTYDVGLFVTDGNGQTHSTTGKVVVADPPPIPPNQPPAAAFSLSGNPVAPGSTVVLDGRASSDPDGPLERFQWDLDGNGSYETDGGAVPTATRRYDEAGLYRVALKVTDAAGATATQTAVLSVLRYDERRRPIVTARGALTRAGVLTARGRIMLSGGVPMVVPCDGVVQAVAKVRGKRVGSTRADVPGSCRYRVRMKIRRKRPRGRVTLQVRYLGSEALFPRAAAPLKLRAR